jgi:hypothetical protein
MEGERDGGGVESDSAEAEGMRDMRPRMRARGASFRNRFLGICREEQKDRVEDVKRSIRGSRVKIGVCANRKIAFGIRGGGIIKLTLHSTNASPTLTVSRASHSWVH